MQIRYPLVPAQDLFRLLAGERKRPHTYFLGVDLVDLREILLSRLQTS